MPCFDETSRRVDEITLGPILATAPPRAGARLTSIWRAAASTAEVRFEMAALSETDTSWAEWGEVWTLRQLWGLKRC